MLLPFLRGKIELAILRQSYSTTLKEKENLHFYYFTIGHINKQILLIVCYLIIYVSVTSESSIYCEFIFSDNLLYYTDKTGFYHSATHLFYSPALRYLFNSLCFLEYLIYMERLEMIVVQLYKFNIGLREHGECKQ